MKKALMPSGLNARTIPLGIGRGIRLDLDFATETRLFLGMYEVELNRHLKRICQPGTTTFDVGGQYGYDALVFAKLTGAPVFSFECDRRSFERLTRTVTLNPRLAPLVEPVQAMVGTGRNGTISVDDYAASTVMPDFIKVDVEGAEVDVLRGATNTLADNHPALVVEVHSADLEQACGRLLVEHGYGPRVVNQRRFLSDYRPTDEVNRWLVAI
jgi:hypothetical protein